MGSALTSFAFLLELEVELDMYADYSKTAEELKDAIVSGLGHPLSQKVDKTITDQETARLAEATLCRRAQTGSFTLNSF